MSSPCAALSTTGTWLLGRRLCCNMASACLCAPLQPVTVDSMGRAPQGRLRPCPPGQHPPLQASPAPSNARQNHPWPAAPQPSAGSMPRACTPPSPTPWPRSLWRSPSLSSRPQSTPSSSTGGLCGSDGGGVRGWVTGVAGWVEHPREGPCARGMLQSGGAPRMRPFAPALHALLYCCLAGGGLPVGPQPETLSARSQHFAVGVDKEFPPSLTPAG